MSVVPSTLPTSHSSVDVSARQRRAPHFAGIGSAEQDFKKPQPMTQPQPGSAQFYGSHALEC
jgi:hypothetical protein